MIWHSALHQNYKFLGDFLTKYSDKIERHRDTNVWFSADLMEIKLQMTKIKNGNINLIFIRNTNHIKTHLISIEKSVRKSGVAITLPINVIKCMA